MTDKTISDFNPLVSVVLATYNGMRFLREQMDSILAQSYSNIEIIISDDRSTDSTVEILKAYQEENKSKKINIYTNKKNVGYSKNFEKAVSHCSGDYIAFCDQDDIWEPNKLSVQFHALYEANALAVFSDAFLVDEYGKDLDVSLWSAVLGRRPPEKIDYRAFYLTNCVTGCTLMIHRQLLESALPFPEDVPHDWWLAYHAAFYEKLILIDEKLVHYRQHAGNVYGVGSKIQKKRWRYYLRSKCAKWNLIKQLKHAVISALKGQRRLKVMYDFEVGVNGTASDELIYLNKWISDRILDKNMSEYYDFFQSDSLVFQLVGPRKRRPENLYYLIRKILFRHMRRILTISLFLLIIGLNYFIK